MGDPTSSAWVVVFYELLTGRRPFRGDSLREIIEQVHQGTDEIPAAVARNIELREPPE